MTTERIVLFIGWVVAAFGCAEWWIAYRRLRAVARELEAMRVARVYRPLLFGPPHVKPPQPPAASPPTGTRWN
jgi:hypothetical protein